MTIPAVPAPAWTDAQVTRQNQLEPAACPPGFDVWLKLTLPRDLDCSPAAMERLPVFVRYCVQRCGRWLLLNADHAEAAAALAIPGVRVERYFRSIFDPLRQCLYDRIGRLCLHAPRCGEVAS